VKYAPKDVGEVTALCCNGEPVDELGFNLTGPMGDSHSGFTRSLSSHDGEYIRTSELKRGHEVFNWRSWTGVSVEELAEVETALGGVSIPVGCLLENLRISGIPNFSKIAPTSRLVFPPRHGDQLILAVWERNGPCKTVGERLAKHHERFELMGQFVQAAQDNRGLMGFVISSGHIYTGDEVLLYPPA
jgi:hypothetical protein